MKKKLGMKKRKIYNKIFGIVSVCFVVGLVFSRAINTVSATDEKTTIYITDSPPWFTKGSHSGHPEYWHSYTHGDHTYIWTYVGGMPGNPSQPDCWAEFRPYLSQPSEYDVYACFYADPQNSDKVPHTVYYDGGSTTILVDQSAPNYFTWREVKLGTWNFKAGADTRVLVTDATGEPYDGYTTLNVDTIKFVNILQPPDPPTLISPGSGSSPGPEIDDLTPIFKWNEVSNADYYGLYIRDLDTNVLVFDSEEDYGPIYGNSFTLPYGNKLDYETPYRWNMRARNSAGWGGFSGRLWFTTYELVEIPDPPTLISPGSSSEPGPTIDTLTPTFQWTEVSNADYYALAISKYPYGPSNVIYRNEQIYGTSLTLPSGTLVYEEKYRWNMQSYNSEGWSAISNILYFQTQTQDEISASIDDYSATPTEMAVGEDVTLSLSFTNTGTILWTFYSALSLRRPDNTVDNSPSLKPITLSPGQQGNAEWTYTVEMEGNWDVVFGIWKESSQENPLGTTGWLTDYISVVLSSSLYQLPATTGKISYFASDDDHPGVCDPAAWGEFLGENCGIDDATRYWYCAMRWPYYDPCTGFLDLSAKSWWHNKKIMVTNPDNGKQVILAVKDWGPCNECIPNCPQSAQERVIDVSFTALNSLGAETDETVNIEFADQNAPLGPVSTGLAGKKICIDPGHGGSQPGAEGYGLLEKDVNLDVALRLRDLLVADGATPIMTRIIDTDVSLQERCGIANNNGCDRFISIHCNAFEDSSAHGAETFWSNSNPRPDESLDLANKVNPKIVSYLSTYNRGVKEDEPYLGYTLYLLRNTNMPAILTELAFITNFDDNTKLKDSYYRQEAAKAILHGLQDHYGETPHDPDYAYPVITSSLEIIQSSPYYVGDTVTVHFTIENKGTAPITFDILTVGGRDPEDQVADFTYIYDITLNPSESYNYQGSLTLAKAGNYHFFCAYKTPDGSWNTCVDLGEGIAHSDRIKNIVAFERESLSPDTVAELRDTIDRRLQQSSKYPPYLLDPNSFTSSVATLWAKFTSWATQTHLTDKYDELYQTGIDYDCLRFKALIDADDSLERSDVISAKKYLEKSYTYEKLSIMSFGATAEVFDNNLEAGEILAEGIKEGCEASVKFGLAVTNPEAAKAADYIYIGVDYAVDRLLLGEEQAVKNAVVKVAVTTIFNEVKLKDLGDRTIADYTKNRVGKITFPMLQKAFQDTEQLQFILSKIIKESGVEIEEKTTEYLLSSILEELEKEVSLEQSEVKSPVELRVCGSQGEVTGLINGEVKHGISRSVYRNGTITIFFPTDSYSYEVVGTERGTYGLEVTSIEDGKITNFTATDIPASTNVIHQYTIDWGALSQDKEGVIVKMDNDGDGDFEKIVITDKDFTNKEYNSIIKEKGDIPEFDLREIPGFELLILIAATAIVLLWRRKRD